MSDQDLATKGADNSDKEIEKSSLELKTGLGRAREQEINSFVAKEAINSKDFCALREKASRAGVSGDELVASLEGRQQELRKVQNDLQAQPVLKILASLGARNINDEEAKIGSIIDSRSNCDQPASRGQERLIAGETENPGRRIASKIIEEGKGAPQENLDPAGPNPKQYWKENQG